MAVVGQETLSQQQTHQAWGHLFVILALWRQRQAAPCEFKASTPYIARGQASQDCQIRLYHKTNQNPKGSQGGCYLRKGT